MKKLQQIVNKINPKPSPQETQNTNHNIPKVSMASINSNREFQKLIKISESKMDLLFDLEEEFRTRQNIEKRRMNNRDKIQKKDKSGSNQKKNTLADYFKKKEFQKKSIDKDPHPVGTYGAENALKLPGSIEINNQLQTIEEIIENSKYRVEPNCGDEPPPDAPKK